MTIILFSWCGLQFGTLIAGTIWNLISPWSKETWNDFWFVAGLVIPVSMAVITAIWFTWGGIADIKSLFVRLKHSKSNRNDDGTVTEHQS